MPSLVAHRGVSRPESPENTVAAVAAAAEVAAAVEIDVRRCGTGELVVIHDATLDRVTDRTGRVAETALDALRTTTVGRSAETVPDLDAVLEAVPTDLGIVLDLKEPGTGPDAVATCAAYDHDVRMSSSDPAVLRAVREVDPEVPTALIARESLPNRALRSAIPGLPVWLYAPEDVDGVVASALELDCEAIHPRYELCLRTDLVRRAHDAGLDVRPWTVAGSDAYRALRDLGVDAVIADV